MIIFPNFIQIENFMCLLYVITRHQELKFGVRVRKGLNVLD